MEYHMSIVVKRITMEIAGSEAAVDSIIAQVMASLENTKGILVSFDGEATETRRRGRKPGRKPGRPAGAKRGPKPGKKKGSYDRSAAAKKMWAKRKAAAAKGGAKRGPGRPAAAAKPIAKKALHIRK
jgi:hypothetical protein